jgi:hypothetical protein
LTNPLIFDPVSRLVVEQPAINPNAPAPGSIVETNSDGVIPPSVSEYAENIIAATALNAGDWVNVFSSNGTKMVQKALAADKTKEAHGYVLAAVASGAEALVYYAGPNTQMPLGAFTSASIGQYVYLSTSVPGAAQTTVPTTASQAKQILGTIIAVNASTVTVMAKMFDQPDSLPSPAGEAGKFLYTPDGQSLAWSNLIGLPAGQANGDLLTTDGSNASWTTFLSFFPSLVSGEFLTNNGTGLSWATLPQELPAMTAGENGYYLTTNGSTCAWTSFPQVLPTQTAGESGMVLTTNGSTAAWAAIPNQLPSQGGAGGKFLTTNGTAISWSTVPSPLPTMVSGSFLTNNGTALSWQAISALPAVSSGTSGMFLTNNGSAPTWATFTFNGMTNPMTTAGDMIYAPAGGNPAVPVRFPIGAAGTLLAVGDNGLPAWVSAPTSALPAQSGKNGFYLSTNGTFAQWTALEAGLAAIPSFTGQTGKFLSTDGTNLEWLQGLTAPGGMTYGDLILGNTSTTFTRLGIGTEGALLAVGTNGLPAWVSAPTSALPAQTGHTGYFLRTDGTNAAWASVADGFSGLPNMTGMNGKILSTDGNTGVWITATPITTEGDLLIGNASNVPDRLAIGATNGMLLAVGSNGLPTWVNPPSDALPAQSGNSGKFLSTNGSSATWATVSVIPAQIAANNGQFLASNGTTAAWTTLPSQLPTMSTGTNGMALTNNGTAASWVAFPTSLPTMSVGTSGMMLTNNGTVAQWTAIPTEIPSQTGNATKVLSTDGTHLQWITAPSGSGGGGTTLPDQTSNAGKVLETDGTNLSWVTPFSLPSQTGQSGKVLETNGTTASWVAPSNGLPPVSGQAGKVLETDGTNLSWVTPSSGSSGMTNPMFAQGQMIVGGTNGAPQAIGAGYNGQILTVVNGMPQFIAPVGAELTNPMTDPGDLIIGGDAGTPVSLAPGLEGQILGISGGIPTYVSPTGVSPASAMLVTTENDNFWAPSDEQGGWGQGQSSMNFQLVPLTVGNTFKITVGGAGSWNGIDSMGLAIDTTGGGNGSSYLVEILVNGVSVANTQANWDPSWQIPVCNGASQPGVYSFNQFTYELRSTSLDPINITVQINGGVDNSIVFYSDDNNGNIDMVQYTPQFLNGNGQAFNTEIYTEQWDYSYKMSGITIDTTPDTNYIFIQPVGQTATPGWIGGVPNTGISIPCNGETSPPWKDTPEATMTEGNWSIPGYAESWHQAKVPTFVGASYVWTVEGAWVNSLGVEMVMNGGNWVLYVAQIYSDIDLTCVITLSTGEVHEVHKHMGVYYDQPNYFPNIEYNGADSVSMSMITYVPSLTNPSTDPFDPYNQNLPQYQMIGMTNPQNYSSNNPPTLWYNSTGNPGSFVFPCVLNYYAKPRMISMSPVTAAGGNNMNLCYTDGNIIVTYRGGTGSTGSTDEYCVFSPNDGFINPILGPIVFPSAGAPNYHLSFADDGTVIGLGYYENYFEGVVRYKNDGSNAPTREIFGTSPPAGVPNPVPSNILCSTMDPTQSDTVYLLTGQYTLMTMTVYEQNFITVYNPYAGFTPLFPNTITTASNNYPSNPVEGGINDPVCFNVGDNPQLTFRQEANGPTLYLTGSSPYVVQIRLNSMTVKIIINRNNLCCPSFPTWNYNGDVYAKGDYLDNANAIQQSMNNYSGSIRPWTPSEGMVLRFIGDGSGTLWWSQPINIPVFNPLYSPDGICETSLTILRDGIPCRLFHAAAQGALGDVAELECFPYMNTTPQEYQIVPNPTDTADTNIGSKSSPNYSPSEYCYYRVPFESNSIEFRLFFPGTVVNISPAFNTAPSEMTNLANMGFCDQMLFDANGILQTIIGKNHAINYVYNSSGALSEKHVAFFQSYLSVGNIIMGVKFDYYFNQNYGISSNPGGEGGV